MATKAFRIKKRYLAGLATWLTQLQLSGRLSRERTRFVSLLTKGIQELEFDRKDILDKYVEKKKDPKTGKEVWVMQEGVDNWKLKEGVEEDFIKEINELFDEEFVIDIGEQHKSKIEAIRDIVLNTDYVFGPSKDDSPDEAQKKIDQAHHYDVWCESFEAIK